MKTIFDSEEGRASVWAAMMVRARENAATKQADKWAKNEAPEPKREPADPADRYRKPPAKEYRFPDLPF
ncbi:hypothetical protein [Caballeronia sp. AZ10_KS36]|uniref:hypothetical protein n=1 Tax=Caballeronia sp. AZ10_KS36 TaxID=2921757 RepID=UPI002028AA35|nr:hypothetical protein [Caballeronia sp. AZ10_KS36]